MSSGNAAVLTASADSVSILHRCDSNVWCHYNLAQCCLYSIAFSVRRQTRQTRWRPEHKPDRPRQGCTSVWQLVSSGMGCGAAQALCR